MTGRERSRGQICGFHCRWPQQGQALSLGAAGTGRTLPGSRGIFQAKCQTGGGGPGDPSTGSREEGGEALASDAPDGPLLREEEATRPLPPWDRTRGSPSSKQHDPQLVLASDTVSPATRSKALPCPFPFQSQHRSRRTVIPMVCLRLGL